MTTEGTDWYEVAIALLAGMTELAGAEYTRPPEPATEEERSEIADRLLAIFGGTCARMLQASNAPNMILLAVHLNAEKFEVAIRRPDSMGDKALAMRLLERLRAVRLKLDVQSPLETWALDLVDKFENLALGAKKRKAFLESEPGED